MHRSILIVGALAATSVSALAAAQQRPSAAPPEAIYWMSADTQTGMATGQMNGSARTLQLQLGSQRRAAGQPSAEHLPPSVLGAGANLPLTTPAGVAVPVGRTNARYDPAQIRGRMLIYWGCGEQARTGQPLTVDMAAIASGKSSPFGAMLTPAAMTPPAAGRHATYGEWPNPQGRTSVPARGSLVGDHAVRGNYSPEMRFSVAAANDFLAPMLPKGSKLPSGAMQVRWPAVPNARAYAASVVGSRSDGTIVMWSSSEVKIANAVHDYLSPGEIARLLQLKALMSPATTQCTVPAEVIKAIDAPMLQMTAYGPEGNYAAAKTDPHRWAVKLRTKSTHMGLLGVELPSIGGREDEDGASDTAEREVRPKKKRGLLRGLGAVLSPLP
jgi:hypothetical protein